MHHRIKTTAGALALTFALAAASALPGFAAGGSSSPPATPSAPQMTPEEEAIQLYNQGLKARDKAWKLEEQHEAKPSDKLAEKITAHFEKAADLQRKAVAKNPLFHQAHSSLGYALRRVGDYEASLAAYNTALELAPDYAEAIEYRAEAYLGLNRLDEAKEAYLQLFRSDRERAGELYSAMQDWLEARREDLGGLDQATVDGFAAWLDERGKVADTTAMLYSPDAVAW